MGRIADAVRTLLQPGWDSRLHRLEADGRAIQAEARAILTECDSMLEKLSTRAARDAKRRAREVQSKVSEDAEVLAPAGGPVVAAPPALDINDPRLPLHEWKARKRQELIQRGVIRQ